MKTNIIAQGAEARIIRIGDNIIKTRISKAYRNPEIDRKIIKSRTKSEAKILEKVSKLIPAPIPLNIDGIIEKSKSKNFGNEIEMPYIEGQKLSENLEKLDWKKICKTIGNQIAKIHDANIIHGDLTTSNMIFGKDKKLYFIDFGLGFISNKIEDKAVDLHLIKQALEAKHFTIHKEAEKIILENYDSKDKQQILTQLKKVEARGRNKH